MAIGEEEMIGVLEVTGKAEFTAKKRSERRRTKILGLGDEGSYLVGTDLGARAKSAEGRREEETLRRGRPWPTMQETINRVDPMKKRRFSSSDSARERN